jgi:ribosomal protein L37AE/L43A
VKLSARASRSGRLICPVCETGHLHSFGGGSARCERCGYVVGTEMLLPLKQIIALPDALGRHACECGHPEMRLLPDGVYHCPACGSEVLAIEMSLDPKRRRCASASPSCKDAETHPEVYTSSEVYSHRAGRKGKKTGHARES